MASKTSLSLLTHGLLLIFVDSKAVVYLNLGSMALEAVVTQFLYQLHTDLSIEYLNVIF